jgi:hypothetical protein
MKNKIKWQGLALILSLVFTFIASCDNGDKETPTIKRSFTLTLLDKTVTVTDTRTGETDKDLEELGIMEKLRGAAALFDTIPTLDEYNRVLNKGLIILVDEPAVLSETYRTKNDGKTMILDINYIKSSETTTNTIGNYIHFAIVDYLDKSLEKTN